MEAQQDNGLARNEVIVCLEATLDALPVPTILIGPDGAIELINAQAGRCFGYLPSEMIGRAVEVMLPEFCSGTRRALPTTGGNLQGQVEASDAIPICCRCKDGSMVAVSLHLRRLQTCRGLSVLASLLGTGRGVERERPSGYDDRYRLLIEGLHDYAITLIDLNGIVTSWNPGAARMSGYSEVEVLGQHISIFYPEQQRLDGTAERNVGSASTQERHEAEGWRVRKDGSRFWANVVFNPLRDADGRLYGFATLTRDCTARRLLQGRLQAIIEAAPVAMVMIDAQGEIVLANAQTEHVFGYTRQELLGQLLEVLVPVRCRAAHAAHRAAFGAMSGAYRMGAGRDLYGLRKDGSEFAVEIGLGQVRTESGPMVIATIMDVTERRHQEAELRRANDALVRSNLELQRFAYVASHDLQTPMRSIASFVQLLARTYADRLDEQAKDWIQRTVDSVRRLQILVDDLLQYSRVDSDAHALQRVAMCEVFEHAVSLLEHAIRESGAEVTRAALPCVLVDRWQMVQVMLNLINNALKYRGADPPRIHVRAERRAGAWLMSVQDNGIGIEAKHHQRIFEIFKRLHASRDIAGSGIGLAICRRVIHRHGGEIWVQSRPGHGSEFLFTLPDAMEPA